MARTEAAVASASILGPPSKQPRAEPTGAVDLSAQLQGLRKLARAAPGAAVVASYGHVIAALRDLLGAAEADEHDAPDLALAAADRGLVTTQLVETVEGLAVLKNLSRRDGAGTGLSVEQADGYVDLVAAALYVLYSRRPGVDLAG